MDEQIIKTDKKNILDKISYWVLLGLTFLIPIFFVPVSFISTQFGTSLIFAYGVIFVLVLYIITALMRGSLDLPQPARYILMSMMIVPIVYTLAGVANGFSRMSFLGYTFDMHTVGFVLLSFAYLFLVSVLFKTRKQIFYSYIAFVISSLILSLFLIVRILFGVKALSFGIFTDITATMVGSWNNVGIFFGAGAILSLFSIEMLSVSKLMKILLVLCLILALFFLTVVNFNLIWVIIGLSSLLLILYKVFVPEATLSTEISQSNQAEGMKKKLTKIPLYSLFVLIVSIVFVIWGSSLGAYLANHMNISNIEVRPSLAVTLNIAKNTLRSRPLFGSGPNTFVTQWLSFKPDDVTSTIYWNTDFTNGIGLIPTFAVTTGIVGVLSWLFFIGFFLYLGVKSIFSRILDPFFKYLNVSSFFVSLYLWIMLFVYVPSTVIFILTFFFTGIFFATVYASGIMPLHMRTFSKNPKTSFIFSLILVSLLVASVGLAYGLLKNSESLWYFQKSSYSLNTNSDIATAESYMYKAIASVPYDVYYRALSEIEVVKLNAIISTDPKTISKDNVANLQKTFSDTLATAIKAGQNAINADSSNYLNWIALGNVYSTVVNPQLNVSGAYQNAQIAYGEALRRNPKNPGILVLLARLAATNNDFNQAKQYALEAISMKSNYLDAYFILSQIELANKNIKGAIDAISAAAIVNPNDSGIFYQLGLLKYNVQDFTGAIDAFEKSVSLSSDYANAKYFLGLSYEATGKHAQSIQEFTDLVKTNPDNNNIKIILTNLQAGKAIFTNAKNTSPVATKKLPVKQSPAAQ